MPEPEEPPQAAGRIHPSWEITRAGMIRVSTERYSSYSCRAVLALFHCLHGSESGEIIRRHTHRVPMTSRRSTFSAIAADHFTYHNGVKVKLVKGSPS